jgi:hypothetical protein
MYWVQVAQHQFGSARHYAPLRGRTGAGRTLPPIEPKIDLSDVALAKAENRQPCAPKARYSFFPKKRDNNLSTEIQPGPAKNRTKAMTKYGKGAALTNWSGSLKT